MAEFAANDLLIKKAQDKLQENKEMITYNELNIGVTQTKKN